MFRICSHSAIGFLTRLISCAVGAHCRASDEIIPPLRAEAEAALRMTEGANPTTPLGSREIAARPVFRGAIRDLDALAAAVAAVGENPSYCTRRRACPPWIFGRPTLAV